MPNPEHDYVTTREATDILGYANPSSVARMVYEGKLTPAYQLGGGKGGSYIFHRADIEAAADARNSVGALIESGAIASIVVIPETDDAA